MVKPIANVPADILDAIYDSAVDRAAWERDGRSTWPLLWRFARSDLVKPETLPGA